MMPGGLGVGVIEKRLITHRHAAHEITRLVIADAVPERAAFLGQMVDAINVGLAPSSTNEPWPSGFECRDKGAEVIPAGFEVAVLIEAGTGW